MRVIAVIGRSTCSESEARLAEEVGALLADNAATLVCGGLGGVMEAACKGAASRGGMTVGILPGNDRAAANRWVSLAIATGVGQARNIAVVRSSQAVIAIGGAFGTLSEIAFALDSGIPVIGIGSWQLDRTYAGDALVRETSSAKEAVDLALRLARDSSKE